jgi:5-formyltetrahydrofolate cyclo-ligase
MPDFSGSAESRPAGKIALRNRLLAQRKAMSPEAVVAAVAPVQATLLDLIRTRLPSTVTAYVPVGREPGGPDLPAVLAAALRPHRGRLLLPVLLNDNDLDWSVFTGTLEPGPRGLLQPPGPRLGPDAITGADLVVAPALAADRHGHRLGRGGGSYDRALARLAPGGSSTDPTPDRFAAGRSFVVALLYDGELVHAVPAEPHDRPVDAAITPGDGLTLR